MSESSSTKPKLVSVAKSSKELVAILEERMHDILDTEVWPVLHELKQKLEKLERTADQNKLPEASR